MANAGCINAIWFDWAFLRTLDTLDSANIGVGVQYCIPAPLDNKRLDYIKYTDKCGCTCCITGENEILVYATNWVIKNFTLTNDDTNEVVNVKWNDLFGSNRAYTMVRYKTWSYPTSITDWTLAVKETTQNQYATNWYNVSGLTDWTTYYFTAFAVSQDGTIIVVQNKTITAEFGWQPWANTVAYYKLETDLKDYSWHNHHLNNSWITFTTLNGVPCAYWNGSSYAYWSDNIFWSWNITFTASIRVKRYQTSWSSPNCLRRFWQPNSNQSAWMWIHAAWASWVPAWTLMIWRWSNDTSTGQQIQNTEWTNVITAYNWSTIRVFINWNKIYEGSYSYNISQKPNRIFTNWNDVDKLYWYLRENIFENVAWTDQQAKDYFKKMSRKFYKQSDYQEVEYIQASWTQYISTLYNPKQTTEFEIDYQIVSYISTYWIPMWTRYEHNNQAYYFWYTNNNRSYYWFWNNKADPSTVYFHWVWTRRKITYHSNVLSNWTQSVTVATNQQPYWYMRVFAEQSWSAVQEQCSMKLYSFKLREGSTLIRDFIPCYRKSDNVIWLFDKVNNYFYVNAWSWTFTKWANVN